MTALNKQALREAAEKATPGEWVYLPENTSIEYDYGSDDSQGSITYMDSGDFTQKQTDLNGAFIAAANPATVLTLLDELEAEKNMREAVEKRNAELTESHSKLRDSMATIHNTIRMDGGYTPLATILNAAKRAHEESATAAGIGVKGE